MGLALKGKKAVARVGLHMLKVNFIMEAFLRWGEKQILNALVEKNERGRPIGAQEEKFYVVQNYQYADR